MRQIELIIFDLDGTLVDSSNDIVDSVNFTLNELGVESKDPQEIKGYIGTGIEDLLIKSAGSEDLYEKAHAVFKNHFTEHCLDTTKLYPGAKAVLEFFKEKQKAIVTNRKGYSAEQVLTALGVKDHFVNILGADDVYCTKPDACPIDKTLKKLSIDNKDRVIMVGDMTIDIMAGKTAGILTCGVTYGIGDKEDIVKSQPDFIIDNIEELKDLIV